MNTYYTQDAIDRLPIITDKAAFVAYYFPILKEAIATKRAKPFLRSSGIPYSQIHQRVMGPFEGLDSEFYYTICSLNRKALENFRPHLTFELRNVNQYKWYYNRQEKRMNAVHDRLHASLQREFDIKRDSIMEDELILRGLHVNSFQSLKTDSMHYSCIYKHLDKNLSTVMSNYLVGTGYQYSGGSTY